MPVEGALNPINSMQSEPPRPQIIWGHSSKSKAARGVSHIRGRPVSISAAMVRVGQPSTGLLAGDPSMRTGLTLHVDPENSSGLSSAFLVDVWELPV